MKKLKEPVLAEGEVTGHAHRVRSKKEVEVFELENGLRKFTITEPVDIVHEEHNLITITEKKSYLSGRVNEWDSFDQEAKAVQD